MKYKINLRLVELEDDNFHLVAPSVFQNNEQCYWVVDTGASKSVFDLNLKHLYETDGETSDQVHTAGIGDKPIHTAIGTLKPFYFGKLLAENMKAALLDLSHINEFYAQAANLQICGLLGGDFLLKNKAEISFKRNLLTLWVNS